MVNGMKRVMFTVVQVLFLLLGAGWYAAHADILSVTCTNDGNGTYGYTFSRGFGDTNYVWGLTDGPNELIHIQSHGTIKTLQPPGWRGTFDTNDVVTWQVITTNGPVFLDGPVAFAIQSTGLTPVAYTADQYLGYVQGDVYSLPDYSFASGGVTEGFDFVGPSTNAAVRPDLNIFLVGTSAVVSWPSSFTGYNLLETGDVTTPGNKWIPDPTPFTSIGLTNYVTNSISLKSYQYYRLKHP